MSKFAVGTCRALVYTFGPQIVACHRCRKFVAMPKLDVPYEPCPFVCEDRGERGEIKDRAEALCGGHPDYGVFHFSEIPVEGDALAMAITQASQPFGLSSLG